MVVCPSCNSSRIRNDYKPAPLWSRLIGIRALLCDHCNRQFKTFCPISPKRASKNGKSRRDRHGGQTVDPAPAVDLGQLRQNVADAQLRQADNIDRMKLSLKPNESGEIVTGQELPVRHDLKTQILKLHSRQEAQQEAQQEVQGAKEPARDQAGQTVLNSMLQCSECGSRNVKRRHRTAIERAALALTDHKAFSCRDCGASFYAKGDEPHEKDRGINVADASMLSGLSPDGKG